MPQGTFKNDGTSEEFRVAGSANVSIVVKGTNTGGTVVLQRHMNDTFQDVTPSLVVAGSPTVYEDIIYSGSVNTRHRLKASGITTGTANQVDWEVTN